MKIKTRVILAIILSMVILCSVLAVGLNLVFYRNFSDIENARMEEDLNRIKSTIENEEVTLNKLSANWGPWDDTYEFVENHNQEYIQNNFGDETFLSSEFNVIAIIDNSGKVVFGADFDLEEKKLAPLSADTEKAVTDDSLLARDTGRGQTGILQTGKGPLLFGTAPILTSKDDGPVRGTVMMGRYLDDALIEKVGFITGMTVTVSSLSEIHSGPAADVRSLSLKHPVATRVLDSRTLSGYLLMTDYKETPFLVISTQSSRDIVSQGRVLFTWIVIGVALLALATIFVAIPLVNSLVLNRLNTLHRFTSRISAGKDFSERVSLKGNDELSALGNEMNAMLDNLSKVNEKLVDSENKYSTLVESSSDGIFIVSREEILYANPRILQMTGLTREEFLNIRSPDVVAPEFVEKTVVQYHNRLHGIPTDESFEIEIKRKNGERVPVEVTTKAIKLNQQDCVMVVLRDITERRQAAKEIEEALKKEKALRQDLEEEARTRSEFINVLAHELRTPLTPVLASLEMLRDSLGKEIGRVQYKLAKNALDGAQNLRGRLEELLDLARSSRGVFTLKLTSVDTASFLRTVAERYSPTLINRQQQLDIHLPESLPTIVADPSRLEQVIVNLLSNASKYSGMKTTISLEASVVPEGLQVAVRDQGIGIPPEDVNRLFSPYHRVEKDAQKYPGIGLGLSVCKQIVEAHKGRIWIESQVGTGSTFKFVIPISQDTHPQD